MPVKTKTIKAGVFYRDFQIRAEDLDEESRSVALSFSSQSPVERFFGKEILDHDEKSVRLDRLQNSGPLLVNHNPDDHVGVLSDIRIDKRSKIGRAVARFGTSARAEEIFNDVKEGIRVHVSVGYRIHDLVLEKSGKDGDTYRATDWEPYEVSIVSMPADLRVGVGRSAPEEEQTINIHEEVEEVADKITEPDNGRSTTPPTDPPAPKIDVNAEREKARKDELKRIQEINGIAEGYEYLGEDAQRAINEGTSVGEFQKVALKRIKEENSKKPTPEADPSEAGLSRKELQNFSFTRAAMYLADPTKFGKTAGLEIEASRAIEDKLGKPPRGLYIPSEVTRTSFQEAGMEKRTLTAGTATDGAELVATNLLASSFIDILRNRMVVRRAGATMLTGLVGDVAIPRKTTASSAAWLSNEGDDVAESEPQFDQVTLTPRTLGAYTDYSRQLLLQSSLDVEALVRNDLAIGLALEIDRAALYGSGGSGQPTGITQTNNINQPTAFAAADPTWDEVVAMESAIAADNADIGSLAYMIDAAMRGAFKTTEKATNTGIFIWEGGNTVNGYPTFVSNQIVDGDVFFANWSDLLIGMWGGVDLLVDPYTLGRSGGIRIIIHQSVDVAVRHPESFAFNNDGT